ncbi:hypothetical protein [Sulfidibacter corallicola]|uniref:Uncharacterized protein n=1 Tax=Sulfidibacter corallicola TaxID=2818388 RepID=A0A8A4THY6_SULCO|nr:hypothetical protein [Sulfidibacter corallicola]QTD49536.1 hypothetical protein J3U87_28450 [Sulfidibacter corallicola]
MLNGDQAVFDLHELALFAPEETVPLSSQRELAFRVRWALDYRWQARIRVEPGVSLHFDARDLAFRNDFGAHRFTLDADGTGLHLDQRFSRHVLEREAGADADFRALLASQVAAYPQLVVVFSGSP